MKLHPFDGSRPAWQTLIWMALRVWLGAVLVLWLAQDAIVFPGWWLRRESTATLDAHAASHGFTRESVLAADGGGTTLWIRSAGADRAVLFWHGNGELVGDHVELAETLNAMGWDFVGVELRGYGDGTGWPRESTLNLDAQAAWGWATAQGYRADRVVLHGRSVGGGPAATLAAAVQPSGLVLEATFDSLATVAGEKVFFLPGVTRLMRTRFDTRALSLPMPVFQVHSEADVVVPVQRARALRAALPNITAVEVRGYRHEDAVLLRDPDARAAWAAWLEGRAPRTVPAPRP